jgi:hypothetical protein
MYSMKRLLIFLTGCMIATSCLAVTCSEVYNDLIDRNIIKEVLEGNERTQIIELTPERINELSFRGNVEGDGPVIRSYKEPRIKSGKSTQVDPKFQKRLSGLGFKSDHQYGREPGISGRQSAILYRWKLEKPVDIETYKRDYLGHMTTTENKFIDRYDTLKRLKMEKMPYILLERLESVKLPIRSAELPIRRTVIQYGGRPDTMELPAPNPDEPGPSWRN